MKIKWKRYLFSANEHDISIQEYIELKLFSILRE